VMGIASRMGEFCLRRYFTFGGFDRRVESGGTTNAPGTPGSQ
jgi:hypothetical protein